MPPLRPKKGRTIDCAAPAWEPLIALAPEHVDDFMWMHEVELEDGTRLHAYKHSQTGRYLHLDQAARAFVFVWETAREANAEAGYQEVDPQRLLALARGQADHLAMMLRQYVAGQFKKVGWTRSATKHRISRRRTRRALENCAFAFKEEPPPGPPWALDRRLVILGEDGHGTPLEIIAVITKDGSLLVIHAMKMRSRYRPLYAGVRRWRK